jgi:hypothetical protein
MRKIFFVAIFAVFAWMGFSKYEARQPALAAIQEEVAPAVPATTHSLPAETQTSTSFKCDGRTHCAQMTSCEEATFFLRNCPDVKMDGNNDGIPCEKQWCK